MEKHLIEKTSVEKSLIEKSPIEKFPAGAPPAGLYDAHAHPGSRAERQERIDKGIVSLISYGTPREAALADDVTAGFSSSSFLLPTYGLHPWHAAEYSVEEMKPYFEKCAVIGEIGMDSVWCGVPLAIQEQAFRAQLSAASQLHKPVILHTKGQEARIAAIIKDYENTYLVHWYSSEKHLEKYTAQNCFFSVGPDVWWNAATARAASLVSLDKILVETDGMDAVLWAYAEGARLGHPILPPNFVPGSVESSLTLTLDFIAGMRGVASDTMRRIVEENFFRFYGK